MFRAFSIVMVYTLLTMSAQAQDPQALMNALIQRQMQRDQLRQQNEIMRLQNERLELEEQQRLRRASDSQIGEDLSRYCPTLEPPCWQAPPNALLEEAARRGIIQYRASAQSPQQPGLDCLTIGDGEGGGFTDCH